ncbi:MAG: formylglycine-generating enzyme family protein, partial [Chitinophagaceae bacterium]
VSRNGDALKFSTKEGDHFLLWAGQPSYQNTFKKFNVGEYQISLYEQFGRFEGDYVLQLLDAENELLDERIVTVVAGEARRISKVVSTLPALEVPVGMVKIPSGRFHFKATEGDAFIPYPQQDLDSTFEMKMMFMDKFPVTNQDFEKFLLQSKYKPSDTHHFLKHWINGKIPKGQEQFPVVYVSIEDAKAYCRWAGKRLPTEIEWQYAAQTSALNEWPWNQTEKVTRKETEVTETLTVSEIQGIMPGVCNLGDGKLYSVGSYPKGANPFGLQDLVGSVWQLTNDEYVNGSYSMIIMKGGSFFKPSSSWWYVQGGPRELHYRQMLLRVSQGFERNATVGFRCVKDSVN